MAKDSVLIERGEPGVAVVVLSGEHDAYGAPRLEEQLLSLLAEDLSVVIDLTRATFLDSVTLFLLLRARKLAAERGLGFSLQLGPEAGKHVHRAFELTKLTSVFAIAPTREGAVTAARTPVESD
jgi:anti-sigma B factor antagonist